eukprot:TRINITY_DN7804_c0_g3_i9.p2 TRINITY_DN7804_c0_g3~~TRINITY_DN7804_c0_g3_i9.p2  ORF type:complete len:228 (-),score=68.24 TRINITY_DN7804_c0_g3_i9:1019-1702(-)
MKKLKEINVKMRDILLDWLIDVHRIFRMAQNTLFLAVNYLDRFLELREVRSDALQLVGTTALFIASKYEDVSSPEIEDFVYITAHSCSKTDIVSTEFLILKTLNHSLTVVTPYVLGRQLCALRNNRDGKVGALSGYLLEMSLFVCEMLKYAPSLQAAAAVYSARKMLKLHPAWTPSLVKYTGYEEGQMRECAEGMCELAQEIESPCFKSMREKHKTTYKLALSKVSF